MNMKTKTSCLLALLLLTAFISSAQNFEGKIVYQNSLKSKLPNVTDQQFNDMLGTKQEYMIKGGNYKSLSNGTMMQWQLYINVDNKIYNKMSNSPAILWMDAAISPDTVVKAEINKNAITILGYQCDELILTCTSGVQKFYFASKLKVDAKLFEKHKLGNWSEYMSRANSLPLKMVIDSPQMTMECVATSVTPMKLDAKEFQLPAGSKVEKSPY
jgi:hypothetical protein